MTNNFRAWTCAKLTEQGQDLAEYALLVALIALFVIIAVTLLAGEISTIFSSIASNISGWG